MANKKELRILGGYSCEEELLENIILQENDLFPQYIGTLCAIYQRRLWSEINGLYEEGLLRLRPVAAVLDYWPHFPIYGYIFWEDGTRIEKNFPITGGAYGGFSRYELQNWVDDISVEYHK